MYSFLEHANNHIPEIKMGNPISVNPCSLAAVKSVLESLKAELDIPHSIQCSIVGCDGLPYLLSHKVVHDNPELQDLLIMLKYICQKVIFNNKSNLCYVRKIKRQIFNARI